MFGGIQRYQVDAGLGVEYVYGAAEPAVHPGRVGHQPHALAVEADVAVVPEDLDAGLDPGGSGTGYEEQRRRAKNVTDMVARQHIITIMKNPTYPTLSWSQPAKRPGTIIERAMKAVQIA